MGVGKNILHKHKRLFAGTGGDPEMFKGEIIGKNLNICLFEAIPATAVSILEYFRIWINVQAWLVQLPATVMSTLENF